MGRMNADAMAETGMSLRAMLSWHLGSNHYPPVPQDMIDPCIDAIYAATEDDWSRKVNLPDGTLYRGMPEAPAWAIVEAHHLESFLPCDDEDY